MRLSVVLLLIAISAVLAGSVTIKSLVFPTETSTSYVKMVSKKPMNLNAFTLCMRVATELPGQREIILFAYRTRYYDELNVWRELDGRLSFALSGGTVMFQVPPFSALQSHLCITWDSSSGASTIFMDGKKSLTKIYKQGHTIQPDGDVIIGQDPDSYLGEFDANQSFVGEMFDINMWDSVLSDRTINDLFIGKRVPRGNVFDWETAEFEVKGEVQVVDRSVTIKSLVFPTETSTSYVKMVSKKPMNLNAFTLCMRVATELPGQREIILFAYRTRYYDELNVWRELDGRLSFALSGGTVMFQVPPFSALQSHLCITWDSSSGASTIFMDGKKSLTKIYKQGHTIQPDGDVIIGQDPDSYLGEFDANQSFVGEMFDINMWDSVLSDRTINDLFIGKRVPRGNVFDWETAEFEVKGEVQVVDRELYL